MHINFTPFPTLTTQHLTLRHLQMEDENEIFTLRSDPEINEYLDRPIAKTMEDARKFIQSISEGIIQNQRIYWAITAKAGDRLMGTICFWNISSQENKTEIGFELLPDHQGKGIMQEALTTVIAYGFEIMELQLIEGEVAPHNSKSIRILKKNGFAYNRKIKDVVIYSLTKLNYNNIVYELD